MSRLLLNFNIFFLLQDFKVDTFEYRLLREVSFREIVTRRYVNEVDAQMSTTIDRSLGPPSSPQVIQKPRNSKLQEGSDAVFAIKIAANPKPRVRLVKNNLCDKSICAISHDNLFKFG